MSDEVDQAHSHDRPVDEPGNREWRRPTCPICGEPADKDVQPDGEVRWCMTCMSGGGWSHG